MRKPIVAGNWKMNLTPAEGVALAAAVRTALADVAAAAGTGAGAVEVVLCPPYPALAAVGEAVAGSGIALGAQNVHWEAKGAFTGEVAAPMLAALGCRYVIVGHSERRTLCGEDDATVNRKARAVLAAGLTPIVCIGETLGEREEERTEAVLARQVAGSLAGLGRDIGRLVLAYEPVWAIGTGRNATSAQAEEAHAFVRRRVALLAGDEAAAAVRIQYGGSVKPDNAAELFREPDVDGGLIGGASLAASSFVAIVRAAG
jgi:triosephosphate isomerase